MTLSSVRSISQLPKRSTNRTALQICTNLSNRSIRNGKEGQRSGRWWRVTLHVTTCSGRNRIIPLVRRPNTDRAPNKPVTLLRNQLLILVHEPIPHCHDTVRGNFTSVDPALLKPMYLVSVEYYWTLTYVAVSSGVPRNFVGGGGVQQIQLRTEDRENGDLGAVAL